jgi:folate-dependent phosphoribosylglycinamide formyltransferase PurN
LLTIGWFSTGRDEAARQLLQVVYHKIQSGEIEGKIAFVFSNREPGEAKESDLFFELARSYRIPLICFSSKGFEATQDVTSKVERETLPKWRLKYDVEVMKRLQGFNSDLCVLAGYMLIVGEEMCHRYDMINLHPAAPQGPKGSWQEVIWTLIEDKAKESGVMMHLVTPELDRGPVITYCTFPIRGEPFDKHWQEIDSRPIAELKKEQGESNALFQLIRQHGLVREFPLIVSTLKAFNQGKIKIEASRIHGHQGKPISGYNLTEEIDKAVGVR